MAEKFNAEKTLGDAVTQLESRQFQNSVLIQVGDCRIIDPDDVYPPFQGPRIILHSDGTGIVSGHAISGDSNDTYTFSDHFFDSDGNHLFSTPEFQVSMPAPEEFYFFGYQFKFNSDLFHRVNKASYTCNC